LIFLEKRKRKKKEEEGKTTTKPNKEKTLEFALLLAYIGFVGSTKSGGDAERSTTAMRELFETTLKEMGYQIVSVEKES
jgi:hypothetical protein